MRDDLAIRILSRREHALSRLHYSQGEITENPHDGGFILVRFLEHPHDPSKVGQEDYVFFNEVREAES